MLPVVAGAFSHEGERKLKCISAVKTPCGVGSVNGHKVKVMRDTGSTTCVVKRSLAEKTARVSQTACGQLTTRQWLRWHRCRPHAIPHSSPFRDQQTPAKYDYTRVSMVVKRCGFYAIRHACPDRSFPTPPTAGPQRRRQRVA